MNGLPPPLRHAIKERLRPTVAQLVRDLVADELHGEAHVAPATEVLLHRIGGMAPHLGAGMAGLTLAFDAWCRARGGPYATLPADARLARLEEWRHLPGPLGGWSQFYEKMSVFAWWSVAEEEEAHAHAAG